MDPDPYGHVWDPDSHENLYGSETLVRTGQICFHMTVSYTLLQLSEMRYRYHLVAAAPSGAVFIQPQAMSHTHPHSPHPWDNSPPTMLHYSLFIPAHNLPVTGYPCYSLSLLQFIPVTIYIYGS